MPDSPTAGMGNILKRNGTAIAQVTNIQPTITVGEAETTPLDATGRMATYVPTRTDVEITLDLNFLPNVGTGNHEEDVLKQIYDPATDNGPQELTGWTIEFNDDGGTTWAFTGFWKSIAPNASRDDALVATATIRVTGTVDWSS